MPAPAPGCDVLVVGGGPSGATAARLLALWGRRVVVVARPQGDEPDLAESLTPSCGKFFDLMGIRAAIDAAGFVHSRGHTVWWGSPVPRVEPFAEGLHGWQATTGRLSQVMLEAAADAGCQFERRALTADEVLAWPAAYRLDCTGRAGVLAKPYGRRRYEPGHRTVALVGRWRRDDAWPLDDPSHTLLESYTDGWAWSVPLDGTRSRAGRHGRPEDHGAGRGDGAAAVYLAEVRKTLHLARSSDGRHARRRPVGMGCFDVLVRPARRRLLAAGRRCRVVHRPPVVGRREEGDGVGLAGRGDAEHRRWPGPSAEGHGLRFYSSREAETYAQFLALTRRHLSDGAPGRPSVLDGSSGRRPRPTATTVPPSRRPSIGSGMRRP